MRLLVLDNYDSFTFNLVLYLQELGAEVAVIRSDDITAAEAIASGAEGFVISPGPGKPEEAGNSMALVHACLETAKPLLGVCLGHQAIGAALGARIVRAEQVMHAKTSPIRHDGSGLFADLPSPMTATRYHSLVVERQGLTADLVITAEAEDGTIQGIRHRSLPIHGVQFHPESIASEHGHALLRNFLRIVERSSAAGQG
jgi:anthranilate synthase component 2